MKQFLLEHVIRICPKSGRFVGFRFQHRWLWPVVGLAALIWFLVRVVPKPARATYPCQRVAAPLAFGFLFYVSGLAGGLWLFRKLRGSLRLPRAARVALGVALSAGTLAWIVFAMPWQFAAASAPEGANNPRGVARGVKPGRVVWAHDPQAVTWPGPNTTLYYDNANCKPNLVAGLLSSSLKSVAGTTTDAAAWDAIFRNFNQTHSRGAVPYASGEKIFIKINGTLCAGIAGTSSATSEKPPKYVDRIDNSPQVVIALLKQLTTQAGVNAADITIGDPGRVMPNYWYNIVHGTAGLENVVYLTRVAYAGSGRVASSWSTTELQWSDPNSSHFNSVTQTDHIPTQIHEATYLINLPILKSHDTGGITVGGKNFYGSLIRNPSASDQPNPSLWYNMHNTRATEAPAMGQYRCIVDLMGHADLGGKTLLTVVDGLFAGQSWDSTPVQWNMAPFNGAWPASVFVSQDPVAVDSVCFDFLVKEWGSSYPGNSGAEDYLHEAAQANSPPSGTVYKPAGVQLASLGVHEHWNDFTRKQYTRNLGTGAGIELVALEGQAPAITSATTAPAAVSLTVAISATNGGGTGSATLTISVGKGTPVINWPNPADIVYGTPLGAAQLNALPGPSSGTFVYTPAAGTVLSAGNDQPLSVTFTPADGANYIAATQTVTLNVLKAPLTIAADNQSKVYGAPLPALTAGYNGFVNNDASSSLAMLPTVTTTATQTSPAGTYPITASGAASPNYTVSYVAGTLTVMPPTPISNPTAAGTATPSPEAPGATVLLVVTITPGSNPRSTGLAVSGNLTAIGGSASQQFYNDGTHGDVTAGDNKFSFQTTVLGTTSTGPKSIAIAVIDDQSRSATTTITLSVSQPSTLEAAANFIFAQFGDGGGYVSSFLLTNSTDTATTATLSFFGSDGTPLSIFSGTFATSVDVQVPAHGSAKLSTSGLPAIAVVGWVRVTTNPKVELGGNAVFQLFGGSTLFSEASVPGVLPVSKIDFFADEEGGFKTGLALCNPGNLTANGTLTLFRKDGTEFGTSPISLDPGHHTAVFLYQIFGASAPSGRAEINLTSGYLAGTALRYHLSSIFSTVSLTVPGFTPSLNAAMFSPAGGIQARLVAEIGKAQSTIDIAIYAFTADPIRDALIAARNRGVVIRIIADSSSADGSGSEIATLEGLGFNLKRMAGLSGGIMHNKVMIIDGKILFTGSYNWSAAAENSNYENAMFVTGSTVIQKYQAEFERIWVR